MFFLSYQRHFSLWLFRSWFLCRDEYFTPSTFIVNLVTSSVRPFKAISIHPHSPAPSCVCQAYTLLVLFLYNTEFCLLVINWCIISGVVVLHFSLVHSCILIIANIDSVFCTSAAYANSRIFALYTHTHTHNYVNSKQVCIYFWPDMFLLQRHSTWYNCIRINRILSCLVCKRWGFY